MMFRARLFGEYVLALIEEQHRWDGELLNIALEMENGPARTAICEGLADHCVTRAEMARAATEMAGA